MDETEEKRKLEEEMAAKAAESEAAPDDAATQSAEGEAPGGAPAEDGTVAETADEPTPGPNPGNGTQPESEAEPEPAQPAPRTFTQEEVNELIGRTRQEARQRAREEFANELRGRYGFQSDSDLDDLIGNGQRFDALNDEFGSQSAMLADLRTENALLRSGIPEERFGDVKAILSYNGKDVTPDTIAEAMATHPEWRPAEAAPAPEGGIPPMPSAMPSPATMTGEQAPRPKPSIVSKVGGLPEGNRGEDERSVAMRLFGRD